MLGFGRRHSARTELIGRFHAAIVDASRAPDLYGPGGLPDTVEGRFEWLTLHALLVLRRLRALPQPADEVAQELVNAVFADLEIALRESGVGDFGVPKRMKKLGQAFYDRIAKYEAALDGDEAAIDRAVADRVGVDPDSLGAVRPYLAAAERELAGCDLDGLLARPPFPRPAPAEPEGAR